MSNPLERYFEINIIHIIQYVKICYSKYDVRKGYGLRLFYPYGFPINFKILCVQHKPVYIDKFY